MVVNIVFNRYFNIIFLEVEMKKNISLSVEKELVEKVKKICDSDKKSLSNFVEELLQEKIGERQSEIAKISSEIKDLLLYSKTCLNLFKIEVNRKNEIYQSVKENPDKVFVVDYKPPVPPSQPGK